MPWIISGVIILMIAILFKSYYETHHFKIKEYVIYTEKIEGIVKFGFITDLHNCCYGHDNKSVINAMIREKISFLIMGGDLISGKRDIGENNPEEYYGNAVAFLKEISKKIPLYYVFGNHETRVKNRKDRNPMYNAYMESIGGLGIQFINNKESIIDCGNNSLLLEGIELTEVVYDEKKGFRMESGKTKSEAYKILAVHSPEFFDEYAKSDADLILCGHNHGGTVRLPFIGGLISRDYRFFPKYSYGEYEKNGKKMILSSGLGDHTIHFRLFNMPEIVVVTLSGEKVFEKEKKSDKI